MLHSLNSADDITSFILSCPVFLRDTLTERYEQAREAGKTGVYLAGLRSAAKYIADPLLANCPYPPDTIAQKLWFRGFIKGVIEAYTDEDSVTYQVARHLLSDGYETGIITEATGLSAAEVNTLKVYMQRQD